MNSVFMIGRLTKDPELRFVAGSGKAVANFTIAVDREFSKEKIADFFPVVVWGKQAETTSQYMSKGKRVAVRGSLQTDKYQDKNDVTRYVTRVVAERVEFLDWGGSDSSGSSSSQARTTGNSSSNSTGDSEDNFDFSAFQSVEDEDVPF